MLEFLAQEQGSANPLISFAPLILIGVVFYFLLIRPQQRRSRAQQELIRAVDVNDEIVMTTGIIGKVVEVDDENEEFVVVEIAPDIEVRMLRAGIARRLNLDDEEDLEDDIDDEDDDAGDTGEGPIKSL